MLSFLNASRIIFLRQGSPALWEAGLSASPPPGTGNPLVIPLPGSLSLFFWWGDVFHDKSYLLFFTVEDKDYLHLSSAGEVLGVLGAEQTSQSSQPCCDADMVNILISKTRVLRPR